MAALPNVNTVKIKLPNLEKGSSYRSWRMRLRAQMVEQDAWDGVQAALDDPAEPIAPMWQGNVVAVNQRRDRVYSKAFISVAASISLDSEVDKLVTAHLADNLIQYLRLLDREFLVLQNIDVNQVSNAFNTERWDYKKGPLREWITNKWSLLLKLGEEYPNDVSRNVAMCRVLCELVPSHFQDVTNRYRVNRPASWRTIEQALKDWESANPAEKAETQGKALVVQMADLQKELQEVKANYAGGNNRNNNNNNHNKNNWKKRNGDKPWNKKKKGGKGGDVWKNNGNGYKGGNKNGNKGGGKKGQKGVSNMECYNCGGIGHSTLYCPTGKQVKDLHKYKS